MYGNERTYEGRFLDAWQALFEEVRPAQGKKDFAEGMPPESAMPGFLCQECRSSPCGGCGTAIIVTGGVWISFPPRDSGKDGCRCDLFGIALLRNALAVCAHI